MSLNEELLMSDIGTKTAIDLRIVLKDMWYLDQSVM